MSKRLLAVLVCMAMGLSGVMFTGCEPDTPEERMEEDLEDARENMEDAAEELGDAMEEAAEEVEDDLERMNE